MLNLPNDFGSVMLLGGILYLALTILGRALLLWLYAKLLNFKSPRYLTALLIALIYVGVSYVFGLTFSLLLLPLVQGNGNWEMLSYLMFLPGFIAEIIALKYMYKTSWGKAIANSLLTGISIFIITLVIGLILVMVLFGGASMLQ